MIKNMFRKGLVFGIIALFIGAGIIPSTVGIKKEKTTNTFLKSGGYIQGLIDNASDGDIIYIPNGTYYENIVINKSISLIGENKNTTIIDGSGSGTVVHISADWINISGFNICNAISGVHISSKWNCISSNIITNNDYGISFGSCYGNIIKENIIFKNKYGLELWIFCSSHNITNNNISNNRYGIFLEGSTSNNINSNIISNNIFGIYLKYRYFWQNFFNAAENNIIKNNFIHNIRNACFIHSFTGGSFFNIWQENYWGKTLTSLKLIFGRIFLFPWINIDWHPAKEPYDIEV